MCQVHEICLSFEQVEGAAKADCQEAQHSLEQQLQQAIADNKQLQQKLASSQQEADNKLAECAVALAHATAQVEQLSKRLEDAQQQTSDMETHVQDYTKVRQWTDACAYVGHCEH